MINNHLEQLVAEWYEFQGFFVRRNVNVGKRPQGGYEGELDIVAFHPELKKVVHIETSLDADSWKKREERFKKKFEAGKKYIPQIFKGFKIPSEIEQIAILFFASKAHRETLAGGKIMLVSELLVEIVKKLSKLKVAKQAIPEQFPLLRTIQFIIECREPIFNELKKMKMLKGL